MLYNFENVAANDERSWLRSVLLSDSPSDDSDADEDTISEAHLSEMLRDHVKRQKYSAKFYKNPEVKKKFSNN